MRNPKSKQYLLVKLLLLVLALGAVLAVIRSLSEPVRPGYEGGLLESYAGEQSAYNWCPQRLLSLRSKAGEIAVTPVKVASLCEVMVYFAKSKGTESFFEAVRASGERGEVVLEFAPSLRVFRVGEKYFVSPSLELALQREGLLQERKSDGVGAGSVSSTMKAQVKAHESKPKPQSN